LDITSGQVYDLLSRQCRVGGETAGSITLEGVVERNRIRLKANVRLPENTKVYVIVPDVQAEQVARVYSPRLAHPAQAADFKMEIIGEPLETIGFLAEGSSCERPTAGTRV
jgi:hypothetical protein